MRQRLEDLIQEQFYATNRVYKTSALLGFYGQQILGRGGADRYGLNSVFAATMADATGDRDCPLFVGEFNRYCSSSGKLAPHRFRVSVNSYETPIENYVRILAEQGDPLVEQLIEDSGIEAFRSAITQYSGARN